MEVMNSMKNDEVSKGVVAMWRKGRFVSLVDIYT